MIVMRVEVLLFILGNFSSEPQFSGDGAVGVIVEKAGMALDTDEQAGAAWGISNRENTSQDY